MGKDEINWGIFSGECLLPFTIRSTKKECIADRVNYLSKQEIFGFDNKLLAHESCRKLIINEFKKD